MPLTSLALRPGQSLEFMQLGASLHEICTELKQQRNVFRKLDLSYSADEPVDTPIVITLPDNGIRLQFDGPDQRLRLIEILDFHRTNFKYKDQDLVPRLETAIHSPNRAKGSLLYRRIYQLFGASYPGEFIPPRGGSGTGTYVLSHPGIAFTFPLQTSAWSPKVDHATMLTTSASAVTSLAIYEGNSWPESRKELFTRKPNNPRCSSLTNARKEGPVDEIEHVRVHGAGRVELVRRSIPTPLWLILSQTTPQDLLTELGPPDQIFTRPAYEGTPPQRAADAKAIPRARRLSTVQNSYGSSTRSTPSSLSSNGTEPYAPSSFSAADDDDDDEDGDNRTIHGGEPEKKIQEQYYCYYTHGFDILLGPPDSVSALPGQPKPESDQDQVAAVPKSDSHKVATRIVLHGNIPGSYPFNRHRRSRWSLASPPYPAAFKHKAADGATEITSESKFTDFHKALISSFEGVWPHKDMSEGMVIVRNWNGRDYEDEAESPSNSAIWIGGKMDEDMHPQRNNALTKTKFGGGGGGGNAFGDDDDEDDDDWDAVEAGGGEDSGATGASKGKREDGWLRNTKLFKFPGLMFEVMEGGAVSALTVY